MTSPWRYKKKVKIYKYRALGDNERHVIDYGISTYVLVEVKDHGVWDHNY